MWGRSELARESRGEPPSPTLGTVCTNREQARSSGHGTGEQLQSLTDTDFSAVNPDRQV